MANILLISVHHSGSVLNAVIEGAHFFIEVLHQMGFCKNGKQ